MAILGVMLQDCDVTHSFIVNTDKKLQEDNVLTNPFRGGIKSFLQENNKVLAVLDIAPIYPNFSILGWLYTLIFFYFFGFSLLLIPGLIVILLSIFWSRYFFILFVYLGLKKLGYKNKIKLISNEEALRRIIWRR
jgi:hypothetical protein